MHHDGDRASSPSPAPHDIVSSAPQPTSFVRIAVLVEDSFSQRPWWPRSRQAIETVLKALERQSDPDSIAFPRQCALVVYGASSDQPVTSTGWTSDVSVIRKAADALNFVGGGSKESTGTALADALAEAVYLSRCPAPNGEAIPAAGAEDARGRPLIHTHLLLLPSTTPASADAIFWPVQQETTAARHAAGYYTHLQEQLLQLLGKNDTKLQVALLEGRCCEHALPGTVDVADLLLLLPHYGLSLTLFLPLALSSKSTAVVDLFLLAHAAHPQLLRSAMQMVVPASGGVLLLSPFAFALLGRRVWAREVAVVVSKRKAAAAANNGVTPPAKHMRLQHQDEVTSAPSTSAAAAVGTTLVATPLPAAQQATAAAAAPEVAAGMFAPPQAAGAPRGVDMQHVITPNGTAAGGGAAGGAAAALQPGARATAAPFPPAAPPQWQQQQQQQQQLVGSSRAGAMSLAPHHQAAAAVGFNPAQGDAAAMAAAAARAISPAATSPPPGLLPTSVTGAPPASAAAAGASGSMWYVVWQGKISVTKRGKVHHLLEVQLCVSQRSWAASGWWKSWPPVMDFAQIITKKQLVALLRDHKLQGHHLQSCHYTTVNVLPAGQELEPRIREQEGSMMALATKVSPGVTAYLCMGAQFQIKHASATPFSLKRNIVILVTSDLENIGLTAAAAAVAQPVAGQQ